MASQTLIECSIHIPSYTSAEPFDQQLAIAPSKDDELAILWRSRSGSSDHCAQQKQEEEEGQQEQRQRCKQKTGGHLLAIPAEESSNCMPAANGCERLRCFNSLKGMRLPGLFRKQHKCFHNELWPSLAILHMALSKATLHLRQVLRHKLWKKPRKAVPRWGRKCLSPRGFTELPSSDATLIHRKPHYPSTQSRSSVLQALGFARPRPPTS